MNRYTCILATFLFGIHLINAQSNLAFEKAIHVNKEDTLLYRILQPADLQTSGKYPLIIFLHGAGERGHDNHKQLIHGSRLFLDSTKLEAYRSMVVFPQCPQDSYWSNVAISTDENGKRKFQFQSGGHPTTPMRLLISLLDSLRSLDFIDTNRIYVGGLSMGGMGTFELVDRRPETFAAAFPICGGGDAGSATKYAQNVRFWVFHGALDDVVDPMLSEAMVQAIGQAGGTVKFTLYPEANHNSWDNAFSEPELFKWLFSQKK